MFTGYNQTEIQRLGHESCNCAVLDTACTSTVQYKYSMWGCYLDIDTLSGVQLGKRKEFQGGKLFKSGGEECFKSIKCLLLPCKLAGNEIIISVNVVHSDIPILLSLESLKKARVKLDVDQRFHGADSRIIFVGVFHRHCSTGRPCPPLEKALSSGTELQTDLVS